RYRPGMASPGIFRTHPSSQVARKQLMDDVAREWPKIITEYTNKDISRQSDKLPAISGLARKMHEQTSQDYYAGLWKFDMAYGTLWFSDHEKAGARLITRYPGSFAATWSWTSVAGPVRYIERKRNQFERKTGEPEVEPL